MMPPMTDGDGSFGPAAVAAALRGRFGRPLRYFDEIGSTNVEASSWARQGAPEGAVVVADHQLAGRGRRGRTWLSAPGTALQFSLVLRPGVPAALGGLITTALGLACCEAVSRLAHIPARLRWPNDVVCRGRKLSGCLVETELSGDRIAIAVAGLGVNVSWDPLPADLGPVATSIAVEARALGGAVPHRADLLAEVLVRFEELYAFLRAGDRGPVVARAEAVSDLLGEDVRVSLPGGDTLTGTALGLTPTGALRLGTGRGETTVHAGDVERVRPS